MCLTTLSNHVSSSATAQSLVNQQPANHRSVTLPQDMQLHMHTPDSEPFACSSSANNSPKFIVSLGSPKMDFTAMTMGMAGGGGSGGVGVSAHSQHSSVSGRPFVSPLALSPAAPVGGVFSPSPDAGTPRAIRVRGFSQEVIRWVSWLSV